MSASTSSRRTKMKCSVGLVRSVFGRCQTSLANAALASSTISVIYIYIYICGGNNQKKVSTYHFLYRFFYRSLSILIGVLTFPLSFLFCSFFLSLQTRACTRSRTIPLTRVHPSILIYSHLVLFQVMVGVYGMVILCCGHCIYIMTNGQYRHENGLMYGIDCVSRLLLILILMLY